MRHRKRVSIYIGVACLLAILAVFPPQPTALNAQINPTQDAIVESIFNQLTPEERVGQLFIVSLYGRDTAAGSDIARLIQEYRIGGVYISATNNNFSNGSTTPSQVLALTNALQNLAQISSSLLMPIRTTPVASLISPSTSEIISPLPTPTSAEPLLPETYNPIPLFIATQHEGGGYPFTQIRNGLTEIPNPMALGATWTPDFAEDVGIVVGQELSLLGVNMLFGPSLDVLDNPRPNLSGALGTRSFGGSPYWVAEMGQAYIRGVHQGGNGRLLTIAKHFPGFGSSDRQINRGVPTILKSLEDLRNTELLPFFRVTQPHLGESNGITDGLMTAHIRYQGLQSNVPISLDAPNLSTLLALQEIAPWRQAGGLLVSAPLGSPASLEAIVTNRSTFPARRLVQDALLAGNDLLFTTEFSFDGSAEERFANLTDAIIFLREQYRSNSNLRQRIDRAVRHIIRAKLKVFGPSLLTARVQQSTDNLSRLSNSDLNLDEIARRGVTLINAPSQPNINPLIAPPQPDDNILIVTDSRPVRDCDTCPLFPIISRVALQETLLRLFGPEATGQIIPQQLISITFSNLNSFISNEPNAAPYAEVIRDAEWIIFVMLDVDTTNYPDSAAVRTLLRNRYDAVRNKTLVLFAFDAPYFLDETEISQLTAYYAMYDTGETYIEAAARLLFQQFQPSGASPVTIPAFGSLDLSPDPEQIIGLEPLARLDSNGAVSAVLPDTPLDLRIGEGLRLRTDTIVDRNGNPVPDGTVVDFFRRYPQEGLALEPVNALTQGGIAEIVIRKERDTPLRITVSSSLAAQSESVDVGPGILDTPTPIPTTQPTVTPTPPPTATPQPMAVIPVVTDSPTATATPTEERLSTFLAARPDKPVSGLSLLYTLLGALLIGIMGFALGSDRFSLEERVRPALVAIAFALVTYTLYAGATMIWEEAAIIQQAARNVWIAPLLSIAAAAVCMGIWFFKPGRFSRLRG